MQYPLPETIGNPYLLVGRAEEFTLLDKLINRIPDRLTKSHAILARRKSGKTAIVQRIFNRLWSANGPVVPFYINIKERKVWLADFAVIFFRTFASQFISFLERDDFLVRNSLTLEQIKDYGLSKGFANLADDAAFIMDYYGRKTGLDMMWDAASSAPDRYAQLYDCRFLVIIDEFQNTGEYIYTDENRKYVDNTIPGTWHDLSESKLAPMLVTGSYVGWLINIIDTYLEAGRLKRISINPYLPPEEGLQAVYKYAEYFQEPITNESALQINRLCMSDPFFISCVFQSFFKGKNLTTAQGVVNTVHYEITNRESEMSMTWGEYIELSLKRINTVNSKHIMLHLSKHADREWTPRELKETLHLDIEENEIKELLINMVKADLIREGGSDIDFQGLEDGTLNLILRNRFEKEIAAYQPDLKQNFHKELQKLKQDKKALQGMIGHLTGKMAEYQLMTEFRSQKRFAPSRYFTNIGDDARLNIVDVKMDVMIQRPDGKKMELDILAQSDCGRMLVVEVKKTKKAIGIASLRDFKAKIDRLASLYPDNQIIPAFFSTGGFTRKAQAFCKQNGIGKAHRIALKWMRE